MGVLPQGLLVSLAFVTPILLTLGLINFVAETRSLRDAGVPRPAFVVWRRIRGRLLPVRLGGATPDLKDRRAWLSWDIRWLAAGRTLARVLMADSETHELTLELDEPITFGPEGRAPRVELRQARFVPNDRRLTSYHRVAVAGRLEPRIQEGLYATAVVVLYPQE